MQRRAASKQARSQSGRKPARAAAGPLVDATALTTAQRAGVACVSCHKKWPRPSVPAGHLANGQLLYRCDDCVVVTELAVTELAVTEPAEEVPQRRLLRRRRPAD